MNDITFKQFLIEIRNYWGKTGAGAIIKSKNTGRYLLAYRSSKVQEPHTWGIWGGKIDDNESHLKAIFRELKEEIGIDIESIIKPKLLYTYKDINFKYYNYLIVVEDEFEPILNYETENFGWFRLKDFPEPLHFGLKELLAQNVLLK